MTSEVEATVDYLKRGILSRKKAFFWLVFGLIVVWLAVRIKEVTLLLLVSYLIALLIDPLVSRLERRGMRRGISVMALASLLFIFVLGFLGVAIPQVVAEYSVLAENFPNYLEQLRQWVSSKADSHVSVKQFLHREELWTHLKEYAAMLGEERIGGWLRTIGDTLLSGYSLALTLLNLILLPFFMYYIACDLHSIHRVIARYLSPSVRAKTEEIGGEILGHVRVFFRGQLLVAVILACLNVIGLSLVGLPSAVFVGATSGLLGVVPYLGVSVGVALATILTLVNDPGWVQLLSVWGVFLVVQILEGTVITPKIVGESMGIHPLGVMLALIIGGQLLGLLGLCIAIPAAAAVRVLFSHAMRAVDIDEQDPGLDESGAMAETEAPA